MGNPGIRRNRPPFSSEPGGSKPGGSNPAGSAGGSEPEPGTGNAAAPPAGQADPWADVCDHPVDPNVPGHEESAGTPPDAAGIAALLLTAMEAFPALDLHGPRQAVAKLWTDTAGEMVATTTGMNSEGVKYAILVIGAFILFAPAIKRRKSPPDRVGGGKRDGENGNPAGNIPVSDPSWKVP